MRRISAARRFLSSTSTSSKEASSAPFCDVVQGPNLLRTPVSRPSPSLMFLPGLRSLPFWTSPDHSRVAYGDPVVSQVVQHLESNAQTIRDEYVKVPPGLKSDYTETDHSKSLHEGKWEWHSYLNKGSIQGNFAHNFGETAKILQQLREDNLLFEGIPFGFSFFSSLHGDSRIEAHTGPMNLRLRIHLPLIVPKLETTGTGDEEMITCGIRVGNVVRPWVEDKALVLDDAYDHEVWNKTEQTRVLLLVDIWHPDVSSEEKQEIVGMFQKARQEGLWKR